MMWHDFIGNAAAVDELRTLAASARGRRPQRTLLLAGPDGSGKTTLALNLGRALNCQSPPEAGAICGACGSCRQAATPGQLAELVAAAEAHRAAEVKTAARQQAPLRVELHPAVFLFPPDGDFLTMAQARAIIHQTHLTPDAGHCWTLIVPEFDRARWATQSVLLKTLEEPPPGVLIILLAANPLALLPTVRSRVQMVRLAPVPIPELVAALQQRGLDAEQAALAAHLAQGCPGRALGLDLAAYRQLRTEALELLQAGLQGGPAEVLLRRSESTRASKEKFESLLEILYSVLQDIIYLQSEFASGVGNVDCLPALRELAQHMSPSSLPGVIERLGHIQVAAQRNSFRPLALASWALELSQPAC
ncbi:MAG: AAA family ATPase [Terriglobales bacterium]